MALAREAADLVSVLKGGRMCGGLLQPASKQPAPKVEAGMTSLFSEASTMPSTPEKMILPDPYSDLPVDGMFPFVRTLSSASTQEPPLYEERLLNSPLSSPILKPLEPGDRSPAALGHGDILLQSELGQWAQAVVEAEENSTRPGSEHERTSESSDGAEDLLLPGILKWRPCKSELGRWAEAMVEAEATFQEHKQARAGGSARRRRPRRRCQRRQRRSDGGPKEPFPRLRPLRSPLGKFAEALCVGGPVLQSELGRWAEAAVAEEEWHKAQPLPSKPCAVDAAGIAHGADVITAASSADGSARTARLKLFHRKCMARRAHTKSDGSRLMMDEDGVMRQAIPAPHGFNFGAALRLKERLAIRRAHEDRVGWWNELLFVDECGVVQGFRFL